MVYKNRNIVLNIFKICLIFPIILLHFTFINENTPLYRISVAMFFIISGYFLLSDNEEKIALKRIKNTLKLLIIGILIYFFYDIIIAYKDGKSISACFEALFYKNFIHDFLIINKPVTSGYHMWFLIALLISYILHYIFIKLKAIKYYPYVALLFLVGYIFTGILFNINGEQASYYYTRNAFFEGFPLIALGYLIHKFNNKFIVNNSKKNIILLLCFILGILFYYMQKIEHKLVGVSLQVYISSVLASAFFLLFIINLKLPECKLYYKLVGYNASFYMYLLHVMVGKLLIRWYELPFDVELCLYTYFVSFAIYEACYLLRVGINIIIYKLKQRIELKKVSGDVS